MRKTISLLLLAVMVFCMTGPAWAERPAFCLEGEGFDSVEELIEQYVEFLNDGNFNGMISCFAIETYVDHFDQAAYIERMGSVVPSMQMMVPAASDYARQMLISDRYGRLASSFYKQFVAYAFIGTEFSDLTEGKTIRLNTPELQEDFFRIGENSEINVNTWKGNVKFLGYADADKITDGKISGESVKRNYERIRTQYGCEEYIDKPCYLEINGTQWLLSFGYGKYDGKWYIVDQGILMNILGADPYFFSLFPTFGQI